MTLRSNAASVGWEWRVVNDSSTPLQIVRESNIRVIGWPDASSETAHLPTGFTCRVLRLGETVLLISGPLSVPAGVPPAANGVQLQVRFSARDTATLTSSGTGRAPTTDNETISGWSATTGAVSLLNRGTAAATWTTAGGTNFPAVKTPFAHWFEFSDATLGWMNSTVFMVYCLRQFMSRGGILCKHIDATRDGDMQLIYYNGYTDLKVAQLTQQVRNGNVIDQRVVVGFQFPKTSDLNMIMSPGTGWRFGTGDLSEVRSIPITPNPAARVDLTTVPFVVGAYNGGNYTCNLDIHEIRLYNADIGVNDMKAIFLELCSDWGVTPP